jgi:hypothetical protein
MMRNSYNMNRRRHEIRKDDIFKNMEAQSSSSEKKGHLQKWVSKTEQPERNEALKEAQICHLQKNTQVTMVTVAYICEMTYE